jgi:NADPH:quinone reductase-like Zn-dependent oxidoreductase
MTDSLRLPLIQSPPWVTRVNANDEMAGRRRLLLQSPICHGSNTEFQLVDARFVAKKPQGLNFVEAAAMPLKYITANEALVERMEIKKGEQVISNGAGGLSSHLFLLRKTLNVPFGFL